MEANSGIINLVEYWRIIWRWRRYTISTIVITTLAAVIISLFLPKWYSATAVVISPSTDSSPLGGIAALAGGGFGGLLGGGDDSDRIMAILKSRTLKEQVIERFNLMQRYELTLKEDGLDWFNEHYNCEIQDENQITISFLDRDQEQVASIVDYIVTCLQNLSVKLSSDKGAQTRDFIASAIQQTLDSLAVLERNIEEFMTKEGVLLLEDQISAGIEYAAAMRAEIMAKEIEYEVSSKSIASDNPKVKQLEQELTSMRSKYLEFTESDLQDGLVPNFKHIPGLTIKEIRFERALEYYTKVLEALGPIYEQARIEAIRNTPNLQVLDHPVRPEKRSKPRRSIIVISAFLLSILLTTFSAVLLDGIYTTLNREGAAPDEITRV